MIKSMFRGFNNVFYGDYFIKIFVISKFVIIKIVEQGSYAKHFMYFKVKDTLSSYFIIF